MRSRTLVLIVGGAVLVLSGIVVAIVGGSQLLVSTISNVTTGPPLIEGKPGEPVAAHPLDCAAQCFTTDTVGDALSTQRDFRVLGLTEEIDRWGDYDSTDAGIEYGYTAIDWGRSEFEPDECFFTYLGTPIAVELGDEPRPGELDTIEFGATQSDEFDSTYLWQSVRVFENSKSAEEHMRSLDDLSRACPGFSSPDYPHSWVTPATALDLPDSVAAIGWVQSTTMDRYYVYDVQRGNVVVRSMLSTWADEVPQEDFHVFIEALATHLAELEVEEPKV